MVKVRTSEKFERILDKIDKSIRIQLDKIIEERLGERRGAPAARAAK